MRLKDLYVERELSLEELHDKIIVLQENQKQLKQDISKELENPDLPYGTEGITDWIKNKVAKYRLKRAQNKAEIRVLISYYGTQLAEEINALLSKIDTSKTPDKITLEVSPAIFTNLSIGGKTDNFLDGLKELGIQVSDKSNISPTMYLYNNHYDQVEKIIKKYPTTIEGLEQAYDEIVNTKILDFDTFVKDYVPKIKPPATLVKDNTTIPYYTKNMKGCTIYLGNEVYLNDMKLLTFMDKNDDNVLDYVFSDVRYNNDNKKKMNIKALTANECKTTLSVLLDLCKDLVSIENEIKDLNEWPGDDLYYTLMDYFEGNKTTTKVDKLNHIVQLFMAPYGELFCAYGPRSFFHENLDAAIKSAYYLVSKSVINLK